MPVKTHRTAVVAIPPPEVWEPIQAIRRQHDRNVHRWMPHITLLYPFMPREQFGEALPRLLEVSRQSAAFQVTLATFQAFTHAFGKATIWLTPEPRHAFVTLQGILQAVFPAYDEQSRFPTGFTPHLSVGQASSPRGRQQLLGDTPGLVAARAVHTYGHRVNLAGGGWAVRGRPRHPLGSPSP